MNIYAIIILATIAVDFVLDLVSNYLNLKSLSKELPDEFDGVYDQETYAKSQEYTKTQTRFGFITGGFDLVVLLGFWFSGGFNWLDEIVRAWGFGELVTGLLYIAVLMVAKSVISLPFSIYSTFVIEERFGFNKTTPKTFVLDLIKGLGLGLLIGMPLLAGILAFFMYTGDLAWLYAWIAITIFSLVMQYVAPTWIMPMFNKFTPLEEGELRTAIEEYTDKVDFPLQGLFVIDGSKRSSKSNAFFTGFGKNKRIALYDTLIENHTNDELIAVLAHEIGHYKKKHIIKGMITSVIQTGAMLFVLSIFLQAEGLFDAFYMDEMSLYAGLIFFGMLYAPIDMILSVFMQISSRKHEYEADEFAATTTGKPEDMIATLKKLSKDNLSNLTPHPFYVFLNYSHPPALQRIKAIREICYE
ncbi:MAG TPA: peptidase M48 [Balneola sp.]|jgi:STE24 endopeptidase|nr:peptidase M48 [Balneola sp.]MAO76350.1 peptidase M48 [Balneola sp.]MBF65541.1 peptidase M48 [Balneola sp.]HAH51675.1 peptidase M48 [Balneola sp.]HAW81755.1 peptidase M48 [Balneola sp.]|tara:strand:- start:7689 stop:8930 length:1242 start_codon:yes stop_codon:yes gene_type:complete